MSVFLCEEHERGVCEWWSKEPDYIRDDCVRLADLTPKEREALPGWWFTVDEVAEQQGVRPGTVHNWIRLGKLRAMKCRAGKRRIMEEDLQAYWEGRPPPQCHEEQESAADAEQEERDRVRDAEAAKKWREAADFIADLARAAQHVDEFAELALREAERRCRAADLGTARSRLRHMEKRERDHWSRGTRWNNPWNAPP
ncbi:helix-turn-helix domain-containing protein [Rubrobacter marinus]|uniref:Helix-turn-helix domain-containing protein n=1 Tax=Rubrobacter marinus TaxID=2653852 RepID=A0A6G8Q0W6_9ACTN|nr:helix-turn-helix domain-containing protein [Rubrobacter marinus]